MTAPIRLTATVAIMRDLDFLMAETGPTPGEGPIELPSSAVAPKETVQEAAARIVAEWTGVPVCPTRLILVGIWDYPDPQGRIVNAAYATALPPGTAARASLHDRRAVWLARNDLAFNTVLGDAWEITRDAFDRFKTGDLDWWDWD